MCFQLKVLCYINKYQAILLFYCVGIYFQFILILHLILFKQSVGFEHLLGLNRLFFDWFHSWCLNTFHSQEENFVIWFLFISVSVCTNDFGWFWVWVFFLVSSGHNQTRFAVWFVWFSNIFFVSCAFRSWRKKNCWNFCKEWNCLVWILMIFFYI